MGKTFRKNEQEHPHQKTSKYGQEKRGEGRRKDFVQFWDETKKRKEA